MNASLLCLAILGQSCPPGAAYCPNPAAPVSTYSFRVASGNPTPWSTAVRISWSSGHGRVIGSGTVIDGSADSALVMTCAHVLRDARALTVEVFGARIDPRNQSVGPPIGSFAGEAVDRDDASDVGLVRFRPGRPLAASPLVPPRWSPSSSGPLCSVGCSGGADPTALADRFLRPVALARSEGPYRGLECANLPPQGRSGGGLFTESGQLAAVCDLATGQTGLYAEPESLRSILRKNGFVELAAGEPATSRKVAPSTAPTSPRPPPEFAPFLPPAPPATPSNLAAIVVTGLGSTAGLGFVGWLAARARKLAPFPVAPDRSESQSPAEVPRPEEILRLLVDSVRARDEADRARREAEDRDRRDGEVLAQLMALIERANAPPKP
jgi:Trypsin-like peptidase domain